jgi:hypothetical protein
MIHELIFEGKTLYLDVETYGINSLNWWLYETPITSGGRLGDGHMCFRVLQDVPIVIYVRGAKLKPSMRGRGLYRQIIHTVSKLYKMDVHSDNELSNDAMKSWENDPLSQFNEDTERWFVTYAKVAEKYLVGIA